MLSGQAAKQTKGDLKKAETQLSSVGMAPKTDKKGDAPAAPATATVPVPTPNPNEPVATAAVEPAKKPFWKIW